MPGEGYIRRLRQRRREIELRSSADLYFRTGLAGFPGCFIVQLHAVRKLEGDGLQLICIKSNHLGPLRAAIYVSLQIVIGKRHIHIRDVRHVLAVVVKIHCQLLTGIIGTGKCIRASVGIGCRHMRNDKTFSGREIRMFLREKSFIPGSLCSVVAHLCKGLPVLQFCNRKCPVSG